MNPPLCLARVDIETLKLNLQWKGFSQNPKERLATRALNKISKHNSKGKGFSSIYPSFGPSISFPYFEQINSFSSKSIEI